MSGNKLVYLAGPITGLTFDGATDWRDKAIAELKDVGITGLSPLRAKEYLKGSKAISDAYPDFGLSTEQAITARDRFDCQRAGLVLFNFLGAEKVSIGSCIEIGWADAARVPIILVIEKTGSVHDHAMVRAVSGWRVDTLEDGLHIAKAVLLP